MTITAAPAAPARPDVDTRAPGSVGPARVAPRERRSWGRMGSRASVAVVVALIGAVYVCNLNGWPIAIDDEGTYVAQAWSLYDGKLAHYTYWYDHPPVGWFQLGLWLGVPSLLGAPPTVELARYVMVGYTLVSAVLLYRLARNLGGRHVTGLVAMLVWALCPLVVAQGRQVLLDNLTTPWLLGALVLATSRRRALWHHVAAGALLGVSVLTKETTLLLAPALAMALWTYAYRPTRAFSLVGATVAGGIVVSFYPLFAMLRDELFSGDGHVSIADAVAFQLVDRAGSGTILDPESNIRELLTGWFAYDSILLWSGLTAAVVCLFVRRLRLVAVAVLVLLAMMLRPGGYVPAMFVIAILPFAALAVALVGALVAPRLSLALDRPGRRIGTVVAAGLAVVAMVAVGSRWSVTLDEATTSDLNANREEALAWMTTHLDQDKRILVDDSYWNNFVGAGWSGDGWSGPIWYYKLDLDPSARDANLPGGWRDIDFIVMSRTLTDSVLNGTPPPELAAAYEHSVPFYTWGDGVDEVQLRRIVPDSQVADAAATRSE